MRYSSGFVSTRAQSLFCRVNPAPLPPGFCTVDADRTAEQALWRIKNGDAVPAPKTLAHFSSPFLSQSSERQSAAESSQQTRRGDGGSAVAPLAGARVRPEPRAAQSSGTTVVPFGPSFRAGASGDPGGQRRRRLGGLLAVASRARSRRAPIGHSAYTGTLTASPSPSPSIAPATAHKGTTGRTRVLLIIVFVVH